MRFSPPFGALVLSIALLGHFSCSKAPGSTGDQAAHRETGSLFREITSEVGLDFRHKVTVAGEYALPEVIGAGVAVFDANGDGRLDLYFVDTGETKGKGAPDRLFLRGEDGRFHDATEGAGLDQTGYGVGVAVGDVDNDGDLDLYVANWGSDGLYLNDGKGRFTDVSARAGMKNDRWASSAAFVDFDLDGFLDIYCANYVRFDPGKVCGAGHREYCGPEAYDGVPDVLYRNRGDGTFENVSKASGIDAVARNGLGVFVEDFNDDGWPDIYVANDGQANELWINQKNGKFTNEALEMGIAVNGNGMAQASMGLTMGDVDADGDLEMFITNIEKESHILYVRTDKLGFHDGTVRSGLAAPTRSHTAWGTVFFDADLDGDLDLAIANGRVARKLPPLPGANVGDHWNGYADKNQFFLNDGKGFFTEGGAGDFGGPIDVYRGLVTVDLDDDGDLDMITTASGSLARVFENTRTGGHWLKVRVRDESLKRDVYNARVYVHAGGVVRQRTIQSAISYATSCATPAHFGLGEATAVDRIEVIWPGGVVERFPGGGVDREVTLTRGGGQK